VTTNLATTSAERAAEVVAEVNAVMPSLVKAARHAKVPVRTVAVLKDATTKHAQPAASDRSVLNAWSVPSAPTASAHSATTAAAKHAANPETKCAWRHRLN
jgi:hypothetical protein